MKVKYLGREYTTKINTQGHLVSEDGKVFFGLNETNLIKGVEKVKLAITLPTSTDLVKDIKAFMDLHSIAYLSGDTRTKLLDKIAAWDLVR